MKKLPYALLLMLVLIGTVSFAQNSIFAGKIVDEDNKPVAGARIKVSQAGNAIEEVQSDNDGLYYTKLLHEGNYNIDVHAKGKYLKAKRVQLKATTNIEWYYNLRMTEKNLEVVITAHDPFMKNKLGKLEAQPVEYDFGGKDERSVRIAIDTATRQSTRILATPKFLFGKQPYIFK